MKIISICVGIALFGFSLFLAFFSNKYGVEVENNKALIQKYCKTARGYLKNGNPKGAEKLAKMAIALDINNKAGYEVLKEIYALARCPECPKCPTTEVNEAKEEPKEAVSQPPQQSAPIQAPAQPGQFEEDEEEGMGC
jgi:Tfp pilus assembly protein PilF